MQKYITLLCVLNWRIVSVITSSLHVLLYKLLYIIHLVVLKCLIKQLLKEYIVYVRLLSETWSSE